MRLAAIIIVYNPDIQSLLSNIKKVVENVEKVFLYLNSPLDCNFYELFPFTDKIEVLGDGENVGIGLALNNVIQFLKGSDFTHVLTLDQDSYFEDGHLKKFRSLVIDCKENNVGVFAPNFNNRGKLLFENTRLPFEYSDAITSGSIFPLNVFDLAGGFNNDLFIDTVDQEFCYRIKNDFGLKTIVFPSIELIHELGYPLKIIFGLTTTLNYSSFRTYYLVRNHIVLWKKYPKLYKKEYKINLIRNYILLRFIKVLLGEKDKINKIKSICRGIADGKNGKIVI